MIFTYDRKIALNPAHVAAIRVKDNGDLGETGRRDERVIAIMASGETYPLSPYRAEPAEIQRIFTDAVAQVDGNN
jgi:hypothetical protein